MSKKFKDESSVEKLLDTSIEKIKTLMDANTVVGQPVFSPNGTVIIPISKIIVGFVAGGGELETGKSVKECHPFAGGSGAGFTVVPIGFLTGKEGNMMFVSTKSEAKYDELIHLANKTLKLIVDNFKK